MDIAIVVGARPNFMKAAPFIRELETRKIDYVLIHTGQHYDPKMSKVFFDDLDMPAPHRFLGVGSGTHAEQTAAVMIGCEKVFLEIKPKMLVVAGDVNSTIAAALVASKLGIPIAHIEAGLRSFDRTMPEEINRILTDQISELLFTPSKDGNENLLREGIDSKKIHFVGNIMIDTLLYCLPLAKERKIWEKFGLKPQKYMVTTLHRPSNVDSQERLTSLLGSLNSLSQHCDIVFPIHPRTKKQMISFGLFEQISQNPHFHLIEPMGYIDFLGLVLQAKCVCTDSGGIQEETTALGIPCITIRENTERPITVEYGSNILAGNDGKNIYQLGKNAIDGSWKQSHIPPLWDGNARRRIVDIIQNWFTTQLQ